MKTLTRKGENRMKALEEVIAQFEDLTKDIKDPLYKSWLKPALVSHITRLTELPRDFVYEAINLIYLSEDC